MKVFTVILSIYLLGLNFVFCEDNCTDVDDVHIELSQDMDTDHKHSDSETDICSSFCYCYCCHIHVINFDLYQSTLPILEIPAEIFSHNEGFIKDVTLTILQPPQLIT
ncbi:DUF6660 family protein [Aquimarina sp. MMG016]|uniref:DUF6660 family protein n=1 Tax=Aquimarina sp. MMG016 TaxID=2822690 RepID=UPI001B3A3921|nr:DUF6660 family protein [Aquimarina sp. MMG016]MBQ4820925.1 hypothetical protein [Aquimarina sp. MMG016]